MTLDELEPEVLLLILEYVNDTSPGTRSSIALTNKYIYSVARLISSRHLRYRFRKYSKFAEFLEKCEAWANDDATLANVRTITIEGTPDSLLTESIALNGLDWTKLATFISRIGKLRELNWNIRFRIPMCVLDALHSNQKYASLRMFDFLAASSDTPDAVAIALANSPALTHLRIHIPANCVGSGAQEHEFRYIVARAPKLQYAGIINRVPSTNDASYISSFPASTAPNTSVRDVTLDGYEMSKTTLDVWSKFFSLPGLRSLKFTRGAISIDYFQHATTMLPNLEHISLNLNQLFVPWGTTSGLLTAVNEYLTICTPCKTLSLWSWREIVSVQELVERHGSSLTSLQLHERETASVLKSRAAITADELEMIADHCPILQELTIDLNRSKSILKLDKNDKNLPCFDVLKRMRSRLKHLTIYFDIGLVKIAHDPLFVYESDSEDLSTDDDVADDDDETGGVAHTAMPSTKRARITNEVAEPTSDKVMEDYIQQIWELLFGDDKMGKLDVKVGEWESMKNKPRPPTAGVSVLHGEYSRTRHFVARPVERDDQKGCTIKKFTVESQLSGWRNERSA